MATNDAVDTLLTRWYDASAAFLNGNPAPVLALWSHQDDVSVANPLGPAVRGWAQVAHTAEQAAATLRAGTVVGYEIVARYVTAELACVVVRERFAAKVGGRADSTPFELRVTMILRPEAGAWKVAHRHADAITTPRPAESILQT